MKAYKVEFEGTGDYGQVCMDSHVFAPKGRYFIESKTPIEWAELPEDIRNKMDEIDAWGTHQLELTPLHESMEKAFSKENIKSLGACMFDKDTVLKEFPEGEISITDDGCVKIGGKGYKINVYDSEVRMSFKEMFHIKHMPLYIAVVE